MCAYIYVYICIHICINTSLPMYLSEYMYYMHTHTNICIHGTHVVLKCVSVSPLSVSPQMHKSLFEYLVVNFCTHEFVATSARTHTHTRTHTRTHIRTHIHTHSHTQTHTHFLSLSHTYMHARTHTHTCKHTHTHIHTHTHTHTQTHRHIILLLHIEYCNIHVNCCNTQTCTATHVYTQ